MTKYYPEPKSSAGRVEIHLEVSNYTTKADLKNTTSVDTLKFNKKVDLANSKSNVDKQGIDRLKNLPNNV